MDQAVEQVLSALEARSKREWSGQMEGSAQIGIAQRDRMLLSVGRDAGRFLNSLAKGSGAKRMLELGSSYGYSTIWLAEAAKATGGRVISLDLADYKQAHAREMLDQAGLQGTVEFHTGDALELVLPKLAPGGIIVADNMLRPAAACCRRR